MFLLLVLQAVPVLEELGLEVFWLAESFLDAGTVIRRIVGCLVLEGLLGGVAIELQRFAHAWSPSCGRVSEEVGFFRGRGEGESLFRQFGIFVDEAFDHFAAEFGLVWRGETLVIGAGIGGSGRCDIVASELSGSHWPLGWILDIGGSVVGRRFEVHDVGSPDVALGG